MFALFYLVTEHRAHPFGWLPFLVILSCPQLHLFMHGGHPQYIAFAFVMFGFLLQWPTLVTLAMFPVLVAYVRLARTEERDALTRFGGAYRSYMAATPAFIPRFSRPNRSIPFHKAS